MNKKLIALIGFLALASFATAQYKTVTFNYERGTFNDNDPLPAETYILFQGAIQSAVTFVEIEVLDSKGKEDRKPLGSALWKRPYDDGGERFELPLNHKLRANHEYDFRISYYEPIGNEERISLANNLYKHLDTYIEQALDMSSRTSIKLTGSSKQVMRDLNDIVKKGMDNYRNRTETSFPGFSEIVKNKLEQIASTNLNKGKFLFFGKSKDESRDSYRKKMVAELKTLIASELEQLLNTDLAKVKDSKYVNNYTTEKTMQTIAIQAGYGGVYFSGNASNLSLGNAPFAGLAFPLGNPTFAPKILSNTSISFGAYLLNFKDNASGNTISGPIFKRPTYIGLSYKVFRFINVNAGAAFLEDATTAGQISGLGSRVFVRPYVGLSIQIRFWADLDK